MRVESSKAGSISAAEAKKAEGAKATDKGKDKKSVSALEGLGLSSAKTTISPQAKEASKAMSVATSTPDIREDRVAALKQKIQSGTYKVESDKIADRLVEDHLSLMSASEG